MPELTNDLEQYIETLNNEWIERRKKVLEPRWNRNLNIMNGIDASSKEFKKDEGGQVKGKEWRSDIVINITRPKIFSVYAMLLDILMPNGEISFALDLADADLDDLPPGMRKLQEDARDRMKKEIKKQLKQRKADQHLMKRLLSILMYAISWSKYNLDEVLETGFREINQAPPGTFPVDGQSENVRFEPYRNQVDVPGNEYRSVWSIYWDMETELGKLNTGKGVFERDMICLYDLRMKMGQPGYIDAAILKVIEEAGEAGSEPEDSDSLKPGLREIENRKKAIDSREQWIRVPRMLADRFEQEELPDIIKGQEPYVGTVYDEEETGDDVFILAETADGKIIKYIRRPDGDLPYKLNVWEENIDQSDDPGTCPVDNLAQIQFLYTGLARLFLDNKRLSANVILGIMRDKLQDPSQVDGGIYPGLLIDFGENVEDVRRALQQVIVEDVGETLMSGFGMADRWQDLVSMLPGRLQGLYSSKDKENTAYEVSQMMENSGKYIGQGVRNIDEYDTEPGITDIYEYNMLDPEFDPKAKGNFKCISGGFTSYKNKVLTAQQIEKILMLLLSSETLSNEAKIREHLEILYKNVGLDDKKFLKTDEEKKAEAEQRAQMEAQARQQAFDDLAMKTRIESEGKMAEKGAEGEIKSTLQEEKGEIDSKLQEEEFQGKVILESMKPAKAAGA